MSPLSRRLGLASITLALGVAACERASEEVGAVVIEAATVPDNATVVSYSAPATLRPGATATVTLKIKNTGSQTWNGTSYFLVSTRPQQNSRWGVSKISAGSLGPGYTKTFQFTITAPKTFGTYDLSWQMYHAGQSVFGQEASKRVAVQGPKVFILSGQSNMVGFGKATTTDMGSRGRAYSNIAIYRAVDDDYVVYKGLADKTQRPAISFAVLQPGTSGDVAGPYGPATFGPEFGIAEILTAAYPNEPLTFIKVAVGGTSLACDWLGNPGCDPQKSPGNVFAYFQQRVNDALALLPADHQIWGMFWMQGESDGTDRIMAQSYGANLRTFVDGKIRPWLGSRASGPLPFVYGQIRPSFWPFAIPVMKGQYDDQRLLASVRCTDAPSFAPTYPPTTIKDDPFGPPHYTSAGQFIVGNALGSALIDLQNGKKIAGCRPFSSPAGDLLSLIE